jgi:hypothetical protein
LLLLEIMLLHFEAYGRLRRISRGANACCCSLVSRPSFSRSSGIRQGQFPNELDVYRDYGQCVLRHTGTVAKDIRRPFGRNSSQFDNDGMACGILVF